MKLGALLILLPVLAVAVMSPKVRPSAKSPAVVAAASQRDADARAIFAKGRAESHDDPVAEQRGSRRPRALRHECGEPESERR